MYTCYLFKRILKASTRISSYNKAQDLISRTITSTQQHDISTATQTHQPSPLGRQKKQPLEEILAILASRTPANPPKPTGNQSTNSRTPYPRLIDKPPPNNKPSPRYTGPALTEYNWMPQLLDFTKSDNESGLLAVRDFCRANGCLTTETYNKLIGHFVHTRKHGMVCTLVADMERDQIPCDAYTYFSVLMHAHNLNNIVWFDELAAHMRKLPMQSELRTFMYNTLVKNALTRNGPLRALKPILLEMGSHGIPRDAFTYSTIIDYFVKQHDPFVKCMKIYSSMRATGVAPTGTTFVSLMTAAKTAEELAVVVKEMNSSGISMTLEIYNSHIHRTALAGDFTRCKSLIREMKEAGTMPDSATYNTLISAYVKKGSMEDCLFTVAEMSSSGVQPDQTTYNIMATGFASIGRFDTALELLEVMRKKNLDVVHPTTAIAQRMIEHGKLQEGLKLFGELIEATTVSTVAYNSVMKALVEANEVSACLNMLNIMRERGVRPDCYTYHSLLQCAIANKEDPYYLVQKMRAENVPIGQFLYNAFILKTNGPPSRSLFLLQEMWSHGFTPTRGCIDKLFKTAARNYDDMTLFTLLKSLPMHNLELFVQTDSKLLLGMLKAFTNTKQRTPKVMAWKHILEKYGIAIPQDAYKLMLDHYFITNELEICVDLLTELDSKQIPYPREWQYGAVTKT